MLRIISEAAICEGNADERFLMLPNIHKNTMKDATGMFCLANYYSLCSLGWVKCC